MFLLTPPPFRDDGETFSSVVLFNARRSEFGLIMYNTTAIINVKAIIR